MTGPDLIDIDFHDSDSEDADQSRRPEVNLTPVRAQWLPPGLGFNIQVAVPADMVTSLQIPTSPRTDIEPTMDVQQLPQPVVSADDTQPDILPSSHRFPATALADTSADEFLSSGIVAGAGHGPGGSGQIDQTPVPRLPTFLPAAAAATPSVPSARTLPAGVRSCHVPAQQTRCRTPHDKTVLRHFSGPALTHTSESIAAQAAGGDDALQVPTDDAAPSKPRQKRSSDTPGKARKSKQDKRTPKQQRDNALKAFPHHFPVSIERDLDEASVLQIIDPITPLHLSADDFTTAKAKPRVWIAKLMSTYNAPAATMPIRWEALLRVEGDKWEDYFQAMIKVAMSKNPKPELLQAVCTTLFRMVIAAHDTTVDVNAGVRDGGAGQELDLELTCIARLEAIIEAMQSLAIVRHDVIMGRGLHSLVGNPKEFAAKKVSNKRGNEVRKPKYRSLVNQSKIVDDVESETQQVADVAGNASDNSGVETDLQTLQAECDALPPAGQGKDREEENED
ncbi:hypothetical protein LTR95_003107, partial [Oleoguttula sp. CCFEE 5521]